MIYKVNEEEAKVIMANLKPEETEEDIVTYKELKDENGESYCGVTKVRQKVDGVPFTFLYWKFLTECPYNKKFKRHLEYATAYRDGDKKGIHRGIITVSGFFNPGIMSEVRILIDEKGKLDKAEVLGIFDNKIKKIILAEVPEIIATTNKMLEKANSLYYDLIAK